MSITQKKWGVSLLWWMSSRRSLDIGMKKSQVFFNNMFDAQGCEEQFYIKLNLYFSLERVIYLTVSYSWRAKLCFYNFGFWFTLKLRQIIFCKLWHFRGFRKKHGRAPLYSNLLFCWKVHTKHQHLAFRPS